MELIKEVSSTVEKSLKAGSIPICIKSEGLIDVPHVEWSIGYVINYNSPARQIVRCGTIPRDELEDLFFHF